MLVYHTTLKKLRQLQGPVLTNGCKQSEDDVGETH